MAKFNKSFPGAWRVAGGKVCALESRFEVHAHVENEIFHPYKKKIQNDLITVQFICLQTPKN